MLLLLPVVCIWVWPKQVASVRVHWYHHGAEVFCELSGPVAERSNSLQKSKLVTVRASGRTAGVAD